jgi:hypothetical protein
VVQYDGISRGAKTVRDRGAEATSSTGHQRHAAR